MNYTSSGNILGDNSLDSGNGVIWGSKFTWLRFTVPNNTGYFPANQDWSRTEPRFIFKSASPNRVKINWGDGSPITDFIPFSYDNNENLYTFKISGEYYEFVGNASTYDVSFYIEDVNSIVSIESFKVDLGKKFPNGIINFLNLETLSLKRGSNIENFPVELSLLSKLKTVQVEGASLDKIPLPIINLPNLLNLSLNDSVYLSKTPENSFSDTNFDELVRAGSLTELKIGGNEITDFPGNFKSITILKRLSINSTQDSDYITKIPDSIEHLDGRRSNLKSFENINRLTQLETFWITDVTDELTQNSFHPDLASVTELKTLWLNSSSTKNDFSAVDNMITNFYNFIKDYATIDETSDVFRDMDVRFSLYFSISKEPSGQYLQPQGYIENQNNGSPVSSQERIWVLVNQYNHSIQHATTDSTLADEYGNTTKRK